MASHGARLHVLRPEYARVRHALGASAHFRELPAASLDRLASIAVVRDVRDATILHRSFEPAPTMWLVLAGSLRVSWPMPGGNSVTLAVIGEGGYFSVGVFVEGALISAECTAAGDTTLAVFEGDALTRLQGIDPALKQYAPRLMLQLIETAVSLFADVVSVPLPQRLARRLMTQALASGRNASHSELEIRVSQTDLATMLGASRSKVNAELRRLEEDGVIRLGYRRLFIRDCARLGQRAGPRVHPL